MKHTKTIKKQLTLLAFALILSSLHCIAFALPNFIVVGVPGSGKGTLSQYLTEQYGYKHVSIGDLIRSHIQDGTELGLQIKEIVKNGDYIDDTITVKLIAQKIEEFSAEQKHFIIDGFPRNQYCLEQLVALLDRLNLAGTMHCIHIDAQDDTCAARIAQRLTCPACARTTSSSLCCSQNQAAQDLKIICTKKVICKCGAELSKRDFDDAATTAKRINFYRKNIAPIIAELKLYYPVHSFNTECSLENCFTWYSELMQQLSQTSPIAHQTSTQAFEHEARVTQAKKNKAIILWDLHNVVLHKDSMDKWQIIDPAVAIIIKKLHALGHSQHIGSNIGQNSYKVLLAPETPEFKEIFNNNIFDFSASQTVDYSINPVIKKPNPEFFSSYLARNGLAASQIIFTDDSEENCAAARNIGMDAILFESPEQFKAELKKRGIEIE